MGTGMTALNNLAASTCIRVALATCPELPRLDADTQWLVAALKKKSVNVSAAVWDDSNVDWAEFDLVVVRSCWDYASRRDEFLAWAERVPHLANPAPVLAWNTDKQYLSDLSNSGIPTIPTTWIGPEDHYVLPEAGEWVIKPAISIASLDTGRYQMGNSNQHQLAFEHVHRLQQSDRMVMMQPYMARVDSEGETAMVFLGGEFSHALSKGAILDGPDVGIDRRFQPSGVRNSETGNRPGPNWNLHKGPSMPCQVTRINWSMRELTWCPRPMALRCSWNSNSPNRCSTLDKCLQLPIGWLLQSRRS